MKGVPMEVSKETCTACAGSMILEMAALSRLTGEPIFEVKYFKFASNLQKYIHIYNFVLYIKLYICMYVCIFTRTRARAVF